MSSPVHAIQHGRAPLFFSWCSEAPPISPLFVFFVVQIAEGSKREAYTVYVRPPLLDGLLGPDQITPPS